MGHLHDLEHRLASPQLGDELGDSDYRFGRELAYETGRVLSDNDAPDCVFKG